MLAFVLAAARWLCWSCGGSVFLSLLLLEYWYWCAKTAAAAAATTTDPPVPRVADKTKRFMVRGVTEEGTTPWVVVVVVLFVCL